MLRRFAIFFLTWIALGTVAADWPFSNPRPEWSRRPGEAAEYETIAAGQTDSGLLWVVRQPRGNGTPLFWLFDRNGEPQPLATSGRSTVRSFNNQTGGPANDFAGPYTLSLFESPERINFLHAMAFLDNRDPLLILELESGKVVSARLTAGKLVQLEEIAAAREKVVIHAAVTADDQAVFLLGERLGVAYLARLDPNGKLEWRRQMVWSQASAKAKSRLLDGFPLKHGGVQVLGELDLPRAAPQVRLVQIDKSGDAGKEKSFTGRALALAGGIGRDGVALYESAGPQPALMMLSLDQQLTENWRESLPIPGRPADGRVSFKPAVENGMLAAAVVDGKLWAVRLTSRGKPAWEFRPDTQARSAAAVVVPDHFFLLTTIDTSGGQPPPFFALALDKFAESE